MPPSWLRTIAEGLTITAAMIAGWDGLARTGQLGWDYLRPTDAATWLPALAIGLTWAGVIERLIMRPSWARWAWRVVIAVAAAWMLRRAESTIQPTAIGWVGGLAAAILGLWGTLDSASRRWPGFALPVLAACAGTAAAAVLMLAGIAKFATMAALPIGVLVGCACAELRRPGGRAIDAAIPMFAVIAPGLLFAGYFNTYSQVPWGAFLSALAGPLALGLGAALAPGRRSRWVAAVVALAVMALAVGSAIAAEWPFTEE